MNLVNFFFGFPELNCFNVISNTKPYNPILIKLSVTAKYFAIVIHKKTLFPI